MQEADAVYVFDGFEHLRSKAQGGIEREGTTGLATPQFSQVLSLQAHHNVVESFIAATTQKLAHMLFA